MSKMPTYLKFTPKAVPLLENYGCQLMRDGTGILPEVSRFFGTGRLECEDYVDEFVWRDGVNVAGVSLYSLDTHPLLRRYQDRT
jgi:hypothetical protein